MSYNEKSAWVMVVLTIALTVLIYLSNAQAITSWLTEGADLHLQLAELGILFVIASIILHTIIGIVFKKDAAAGQDERDRSVMYKSGAMAGSFLGFVVMWAVWTFHTGQSANLMFVICLFGLLIATALNFVLQIVFYRRGY